MTPFAEVNQTIEWTTRLVCFSVLIGFLEQLFNFREFAEGETFDWNFLKTHASFSQRRRMVLKLANLFFENRRWLLLLMIGSALAVFLIFFPTYQFLLLGVFFIVGLENFRLSPLGTDTPNRLNLVITGALLLRQIEPSETITYFCLIFIALESCLSYFTAGFVKLLNQNWRQGLGLEQVFQKESNGITTTLTTFFKKQTNFIKVFNYFIIAFECSFPFALIIGKPYFLFFIIGGFVFHLSNAIFLGLNRYLWSWIATYPALIFISQR